MSTSGFRPCNPGDYELNEVNDAPGFAKAVGVDDFEYLSWPAFPSPWVVTLVLFNGWLGVLLDDYDGAFARETHALIKEGLLRPDRDYLRLPAKVAKVISRLVHPQSGMHDHEPVAPRVLLTLQGRMRALRVVDLAYMTVPVGEALLARATPSKGDA